MDGHILHNGYAVNRRIQHKAAVVPVYGEHIFFCYVVGLSHKFTPDMKEILKGLAGAILSALAVHIVLFLAKAPFGALDPIVYNGLAFVKIFIWHIAMGMCEKIKGL